MFVYRQEIDKLLNHAQCWTKKIPLEIQNLCKSSLFICVHLWVLDQYSSFFSFGNLNQVAPTTAIDMAPPMMIAGMLPNHFDVTPLSN